jgi:hypothetical protein
MAPFFGCIFVVGLQADCLLATYKQWALSKLCREITPIGFCGLLATHKQWALSKLCREITPAKARLLWFACNTQTMGVEQAL